MRNMKQHLEDKRLKKRKKPSKRRKRSNLRSVLRRNFLDDAQNTSGWFWQETSQNHPGAPVRASAAGVGLLPVLPGSGQGCDVIADIRSFAEALGFESGSN